VRGILDIFILLQSAKRMKPQTVSLGFLFLQKLKLIYNDIALNNCKIQIPSSSTIQNTRFNKQMKLMDIQNSPDKFYRLTMTINSDFIKYWL
jgi:hypothetical protein